MFLSVQKNEKPPFFIALFFVLCFFPACSAPKAETGKTAGEVLSLPSEISVKDSGKADFSRTELNRPLEPALEEIAEFERTEGFAPGLGIAESQIREKAGDYPGAVLAVFKELCWAYGAGKEGVTRETVLQGLAGIHGLQLGKEAEAATGAAAAFFEGRWKEAGTLVEEIFKNETEADHFSKWIVLVCSMETGEASPEFRSAYSVIRARYAAFAEFWYRGARCWDRLENNPVKTAFWAERAVNLAPAGPFAAECRELLAKASGLNAGDAPAVKTRAEVDALGSAAVQSGKPELLAEILPLMALPDNPYTMYASGVLRALASLDQFRLWFSSQGKTAKGRLAERLLYISRG